MKYNEKYDLYLDDDLVIYYWDKKKDKLIQRAICKNNAGYPVVNTKIGVKRVHRIIYETFVGPIPDGYEIDHINAIKTDYRLENLRCVTHKENMNNPLSREVQKGNTNGKSNKGRISPTKGKPTSEFGRKFFEHYGIAKYENTKLYNKEYVWYRNHNKCRWEVK